MRSTLTVVGCACVGLVCYHVGTLIPAFGIFNSALTTAYMRSARQAVS